MTHFICVVQGFSILALFTFWTRLFFVGGLGIAVLCIVGWQEPWPLPIRWTPPVVQSKCVQILPDISWGTKPLPAENQSIAHT